MAGLKPSREPWSATLWSFGTLGCLLNVLLIASLLLLFSREESVVGLIVFASGLVWVVVLFTVLARRYRTETQASVRAKIRVHQETRRSQPRDLVALAAAGSVGRRGWYAAARRCARRGSLARITFALPIAVLFSAEGASSFHDLYPPLGLPVGGLGMLFAIGVIAWSFHKRLRDPLVFCGQVEGVQPGLEKGGATNWILYGRTRTVRIEPRAVCRLQKNGELRSAQISGPQKLGVRRAVAKQLMHGEHCALVCSGAGDVLYRCGSLAAVAADKSLVMN